MNTTIDIPKAKVFRFEGFLQDNIIETIDDLKEFHSQRCRHRQLAEEITTYDIYIHWLASSIERNGPYQFIPMGHPTPCISLQLDIDEALARYDSVLRYFIVVPKNFSNLFTLDRIEDDAIIMRGL